MSLKGVYMKTLKEVEVLEKLIGQLKGLHAEISQLARKSPNDGLNPFKLKLITKLSRRETKS